MYVYDEDKSDETLDSLVVVLFLYGGVSYPENIGNELQIETVKTVNSQR